MKSNASDLSPISIKPKGVSFQCSPEYVAMFQIDMAMKPYHDKAHDILIRDLKNRIGALNEPPITDEELAFLDAYRSARLDDEEEYLCPQ